MNIRHFFLDDNNRPRTLWSIIIFTSVLLLAVSPLIVVENSHLQFFGAIFLLVFGLHLNSRYLDKVEFAEYGLLLKKQTLIHLTVGILIGILSVGLIFFIGKSAGVLLVSSAEFAPNTSLLLLFALKTLLVGIWEETFFRGYLFTTIAKDLESKINYRGAVLVAITISSMLFGMAHLGTSNTSILSIVFLTINGMVWCVPFIITKNLGLSIGLHAAWNFTQTQIGFTMSGNKATNAFYTIENHVSDLWTGGEYGPEAGILGLLGFATMLLLSLVYLRFRKSSSINTQPLRNSNKDWE